MSKPIVLITSASGRIGKELIALLARNKNFVIRACCFSSNKESALLALGADEVVAFDLNDAGTWKAALEGVSTVYYSSLNVTVLRNNFFMNYLLKTDCESIETEGWFSNPLGSARNSFVATRDIAEAAARILAEGADKHADKFYDLNGPEPQTMDEIAGDLSKAMGKSIQYRAQSMESFENDFGSTRAEFFEYLSNGRRFENQLVP